MPRPKDFSAVPLDFEFNGVRHQQSISDDSHIDQDNINQELAEHAQHYSWWATMLELMKDKLDREKTALGRLYANIDHRERNKVNEINRQAQNPAQRIKHTEKMFENVVLTDDEYVKAQNAMQETKKNVGLLQVGVKSMEQRKDCLVTLGHNYRAEGQADPVILKESIRERYRKKQEQREQQEQQEQRESPKKKPPGKKKVGK